MAALPERKPSVLSREEFFELLDNGFKFQPPDEAIIKFFNQKHNGVAEPSFVIFDDMDFYKKSPEQLSERLPNHEVLFFTRILRNYQNPDVPQRSNVHGVRKLVTIPKDIKEGDQTVGTKTTLRFERRIGSEKTGWCVDEFQIINPDQPAVLFT